MSDARQWKRGPPEPHWPLVRVGHNGGPPLDDEPPGKLLLVRHHWKRAHAAARRNPPMAILQFRVRRVEAAGVSYEAYMSELLDTGRHLQREDAEKCKPAHGDAPLDRRGKRET